MNAIHRGSNQAVVKVSSILGDRAIQVHYIVNHKNRTVIQYNMQNSCISVTWAVPVPSASSLIKVESHVSLIVIGL